MGEGHGHGITRAPRASERTANLLAAFVGAAIILTIIGAIFVWPKDQDFRGTYPTVEEGSSWHSGVIDVVADDQMTATVVLDDEEAAGPQELRLLDEYGRVLPSAGDRVRVLETPEGELIFGDFDRRGSILGWLIAYIVVVIGVAWWRGLGALLGLAIALGIVIFFTIPSLYHGNNPLVVGLVTGAGAMIVLLYLAHGVNARSTTALLGTLAGLGVTGLLGAWAVSSTHLTGIWDSDGAHLTYLNEGISVTGMVLCGVILAGLGVLNDVTVTQASAVWELRAANPSATRLELFTRGMRIGRDHIASTVYTIAFAYVGAGLPAIMMLSLFDANVVQSLTSADIAEEVVRTLVGSIGLVLAVPLTTLIGAAVIGSQAIADGDGGDGHGAAPSGPGSAPKPALTPRPGSVPKPRPVK